MKICEGEGERDPKVRMWNRGVERGRKGSRSEEGKGKRGRTQEEKRAQGRKNRRLTSI